MSTFLLRQEKRHLQPVAECGFFTLLRMFKPFFPSSVFLVTPSLSLIGLKRGIIRLWAESIPTRCIPSDELWMLSTRPMSSRFSFSSMHNLAACI